jgi:hypothetical protein
VPERRSSRFALEVLFLVALAAALTFADLEALEVAGLMLLGWVLVAIFEWASMRSEPHYGRGLPPRYYVPRVSLPPNLPLDRADPRFPVPDLRGDAATWLVPGQDDGGDDWPWLRENEQLPVAEETEIREPVEPVTSVATVGEEVAVELPLDPVVEEGEVEPPLDPRATQEQVAEVQVDSPVVPEAGATREVSDADSSPSVARTDRHRIDPLQPSPGRRRRRRDENDGMIEVPARPAVRVLPGTSRRDQ